MANARPGILLLFLLLAATEISTIVTAQAPGPAPSEAMAPSPAPALDCFTSLLNLSDCLTYVEEGSNLTKPEKGCCPGLSGLISSAPVCLCELLANTSAAGSFGIQIDRNRALNLQNVCKVDASLSLCSLLGVPVSAPSESPAGGPSGGGSAPSSPSQGTNHGVSNSRISVLGILISLSGFVVSIF